MNLLENVSLKPYNTFGIDVSAKYFSTFNNIEQLQAILENNDLNSLPRLILGGGSNMLFTKNFEGIVLRNRIPGIEVVNEDSAYWFVKSGAGVLWHDLVLWCIDRGYQGIENLSLIPGTAGAAPIQNIGAYGVELKDTFYQLEAIDLTTGKLIVYDKEACDFGYRQSVFKSELKGRFIITSIILALRKQPQYNVSYGAITQELSKMGVESPDAKSISQAVVKIRQSKLPDPAKIGNAGSFFKNPEVSASQYELLHKSFPDMVSYPLPDGNYKLAAGWLIEQCGWKGKVVGNTGSHKDQALVLVNYGNATGNEIRDLAYQILDSVKQRFGVAIEPEVNII